MTHPEPPHVDEHTTIIAADVEQIWPALINTLERAFSGALSAGYSRLVGCADAKASGPRPLAQGSTVPGFRVVAAVSGSELILEGRHRFSSYALIFRLEQLASGQSRLRAETLASFPGRRGAVYRLLVIRSGGHVLAVRRLLAVVKGRAERGE